MFIAELISIEEAIKLTADKYPEKKTINIISDSKSSVDAIRNYDHKNQIVHNIKNMIHENRKINRYYRLYWTRAHVGEWGNEIADHHAKQATTKTTIDRHIKIYKSQITSISKQQMLRQWQERWDTSTTGRNLYTITNKVNINYLSGNFYINQALTGHGAFPTYQNRFFNKSDKCTCGAIGTREHILLQCDKYNNIRNKYFKTNDFKLLFN